MEEERHRVGLLPSVVENRGVLAQCSSGKTGEGWGRECRRRWSVRSNDSDDEMDGDKKLDDSWDVVAGTATRSMMLEAWLNVSSSPTQGGGGSVQCGRREKRALTLLISSGRWQLYSKAVTEG
jgi:hypothetical protein